SRRPELVDAAGRGSASQRDAARGRKGPGYGNATPARNISPTIRISRNDGSATEVNQAVKDEVAGVRDSAAAIVVGAAHRAEKGGIAADMHLSQVASNESAANNNRVA